MYSSCTWNNVCEGCLVGVWKWDVQSLWFRIVGGEAGIYSVVRGMLTVVGDMRSYLSLYGVVILLAPFSDYIIRAEWYFQEVCEHAHLYFIFNFIFLRRRRCACAYVHPRGLQVAGAAAATRTHVSKRP